MNQRDRFTLASNGGLLRTTRWGGRERILSLELGWNLEHATVIVLPMVRIGEEPDGALRAGATTAKS